MGNASSRGLPKPPAGPVFSGCHRNSWEVVVKFDFGLQIPVRRFDSGPGLQLNQRVARRSATRMKGTLRRQPLLAWRVSPCSDQSVTAVTAAGQSKGLASDDAGMVSHEQSPWVDRAASWGSRGPFQFWGMFRRRIDYSLFEGGSVNGRAMRMDQSACSSISVIERPPAIMAANNDDDCGRIRWVKKSAVATFDR